MFYDMFDKLCKDKGVSPSGACVDMGLSRSLGAKWKSKGENPSYEVLQKIAEYFGVTTDYLVGKEKPATDDDELNSYLDELRTRPEMRMLFKLSKGATKEDVEQAVKIIEALRK